MYLIFFKILFWRDCGCYCFPEEAMTSERNWFHLSYTLDPVVFPEPLKYILSAWSSHHHLSPIPSPLPIYYTHTHTQHIYMFIYIHVYVYLCVWYIYFLLFINKCPFQYFFPKILLFSHQDFTVQISQSLHCDTFLDKSRQSHPG